jgi:hypothetical protein
MSQESVELVERAIAAYSRMAETPTDLFDPEDVAPEFWARLDPILSYTNAPSSLAGVWHQSRSPRSRGTAGLGDVWADQSRGGGTESGNRGRESQ